MLSGKILFAKKKVMDYESSLRNLRNYLAKPRHRYVRADWVKPYDRADILRDFPTVRFVNDYFY